MITDDFLVVSSSCTEREKESERERERENERETERENERENRRKREKRKVKLFFYGNQIKKCFSSTSQFLISGDNTKKLTLLLYCCVLKSFFHEHPAHCAAVRGNIFL